ncbi:MAG: hypothetical protein HRT68_02880 [Flavobacteriaceae bacterium]|nr:hypothetical protein [Flavobacteriaceae bacterium]
MKKSKLSADNLWFKKYFVSSFYTIIGILAITTKPFDSLIVIIIGIVLLVMAIFYFLLKDLYYNQEFVFFGSNKYEYSNVTKINTFEFSNTEIIYFITSDGKRHYTISKSLGWWSILGLLFKRKSSKIQEMEDFFLLLKEKGSITPNRR